MKKNLIIIMTLLIALVNIQIVNAAYDPNHGVAMSVGTNYSSTLQSDIDTTQDAINAQTAFASMGFNSYYQNVPTYQYLRGNNPYTGLPRMESKILFFSGHGNYNSITFNYKKQGGDKKTGIWWENNYDSSNSGYKYAGIYSYNMNKVKLAIFGACQTASAFDNIAKRANDKGVETSLGWSVSIAAASHSQWFNNFFTELKKSGRTVQAAINYANSISYVDNRVKNVVIYGNPQYTPTWDTGLQSINQPLSYKQKEYVVSRKIEKTFDENNIKNIINTIIKEKISKDFNINDYYYEINGSGNTKYIDLSYMFNGAKTSSSYTIVIENNIITRIVDNTKPIPQNSLKNTITDLNVKNYLNDIKKKLLSENKNYEIISQKSEIIYDIYDTKYKVLSFTEVKDVETQTFYVYENIN